MDSWNYKICNKDSVDNDFDNFEDFIESIDFDDPKYKDIKSPDISLLENEALKYNNFEDFEYAFLGQLKHGLYWHVTNDPNFSIDPEKGPRDMSSLSFGNNYPGKLMITSHLGNWASEYYPKRKYAALIDMSNVDKDDYLQSARGFGNEFFVNNPEKAVVLGVYPLDEAVYIDSMYNNLKPKNREQLREIFDRAHRKAFEKEIE